MIDNLTKIKNYAKDCIFNVYIIARQVDGNRKDYSKTYEKIENVSINEVGKQYEDIKALCLKHNARAYLQTTNNFKDYLVNCDNKYYSTNQILYIKSVVKRNTASLELTLPTPDGTQFLFSFLADTHDPKLLHITQGGFLHLYSDIKKRNKVK